MREKMISKRKKKEQFRFLAVVLLFLLCGVGYSYQFYRGGLEIGTEISAEEFIKPVGKLEKEDKININSASASELMRISGIGEKRAADIIAYREERGGFSSIEEIMNISGIGEKTFQEIKNQITVDEI